MVKSCLYCSLNFALMVELSVVGGLSGVALLLVGTSVFV